MNELVATAVAQAVGEDAVLGTPQRRSWSWQIPVSIGTSSLVLKVPRWEGINSLEAAITAGPQPSTVAEYEALVALEALVAAAQDPELRAIHPVGFLEEVNGILMEWFDGMTLRAAARPFASNDHVADVFKRAGRIVSLVHRSGSVTRSQLDSVAMSSELELLVSELERPGRRLERAVAGFLDRIKAMGPIELPMGQVHGDLNLNNLLVDDAGRVALIDPNPGTGSLLRDQALLVGDLAFDRIQLMTRGLWRPSGRRARWAAAFEAELGLVDDPARPVIDAFELLVRWVRLRALNGRFAAGVVAATEGYLAVAVSRSTGALDG